MDTHEEVRRYRERMNKRILAANNLNIKRFFALDTRAYEKGALDVKTKVLMGLVASAVLRCNDCITYHVIRCVQEGASDAELFESLNVALVVAAAPSQFRICAEQSTCLTNVGRNRKSTRSSSSEAELQSCATAPLI